MSDHQPQPAHPQTKHGDRLFESLQAIAGDRTLNPEADSAPFVPFESLDASHAGELRKMKKFRFQLLHRWFVERFQACRVADIGGGKGLLAYLLQRDAWPSAVIDPHHQALPHKYKDIASGKRVKVPASDSVRHIDRPFAKPMAQEFDMLVGMHAHGCNVDIIDISAELGCGFVLFPCCVIEEPFFPVLGVHWLESLADYAMRRGHRLYPFRLNFKGQNIGLCSVGERTPLLADL